MAIVFEKLPASGEKCLILGSREALFYPFDFGSGWTEIRFGTVHSMTNLNESNGSFTAETIASGPPSNSPYYGFVYSPNNELPYASGVYYIGSAGSTGASVTCSNASPSNFMTQNPDNVFINESILRSQLVVGAILHGPTAVESSGNNIFAAGTVSRLRIDQINKTFNFNSSRNTSIFGGRTANTTTENLRAGMAAFAFSTQFTGFYTENGTQTGNLLPLPNKILIYMPFVSNRLRIHNLVIEKYA